MLRGSGRAAPALRTTLTSEKRHERSSLRKPRTGLRRRLLVHACARALVGRPDIVFADEPTGNLDSTSGAEVLGFLRRVVDTHGQTVVMVTHDPGAASWTDRVVFLADGKVVDELREPTPELVLEKMAALGRPVGA